ncbi:MAG: prephenate dehydrogenase/arogenate dehydrogenase family protein [Planctomycetes bacterium]|nr:prephenate dehydrogenase/arogenate dehydrogenase family protein [Planctomycetota bacterium]
MRKCVPVEVVGKSLGRDGRGVTDAMIPADRWDTVAIVGVGLIGGSIGLAMQRRGLVRRVVGIGRREESLRRAERHGAVTEATTCLSEGVADAELVVVCTPVADIVERVRQAARFCRATALITDVGSCKAGIVRALRRMPIGGASFIGSHPIAGGERAGPEHADSDLFVGRVVVVTPTSASDRGQVARLTRFWESLGATVLEMTAPRHDRIVASTSHVVHLVASALAAATAPAELRLAGSGWRDTTRVAAADAGLWQQILSGNRDAVLKSLDRFERVLLRFREALERQDTVGIERLLDAGKKIRDTLGN